MIKTLNSLFIRFKKEPPVAAAILTIFIFTCPVFISIAANGAILLPAGFSSSIVVEPIYGVFALIINIILLCIFASAPIFKVGFQSIIAPDVLRKALIFFYIGISFYCFYVINEKLNFFTSLLDDPLVAMLRLGSDLVEENVLRYYFYGVSGCIAFALVEKNDSIFLKSISFISMIAIVLFYFFIGRREVSIMTLCFLFLLKRNKIRPVYLVIIGVFIIGVIVFILNLRVGDDNGFLFSTNSEELSTVAYSSYVIKTAHPNIIGSFTEATFLRPYLMPSNISATFVKADSGYSDSAGPVLGIAGITYMYGFIIPCVTVFIMGSFFRTVSREFQKKKTPIIKLLLIYITFRAFNLFRNGEFPIVTIDLIKFFILTMPALFLKFNDTAATIDLN